MSLLDRIEVLKKVIDIMPDGVWVTDETGKILYGNPAGQKIWGAADVGPQRFGEFRARWVANGKRIEAEEWAAARAIRKGDISINEEVEIECFDGSRKIVLNSALPIRDESGSILGAIVVNHDITERKRVEDRLRSMASHDPLTNTYTRRVLYDFIDTEIHRVRRHGGELSVIMFDVDQFKEINDDHGHVAGDRVLVALVEIVREELRGLDRLARYGGEEFLVIAPNTTLRKAVVLAERLRTQIATASFDTVARITCSFGVCEFEDDQDADTLVRRVEDLMFKATRSGRNSLVAE